MVTTATGISRIERFFRAVAGLDIDKSDVKRYREFINQKLVDLLIRGEAIAKANGRDVIRPTDLPITKGLQERIHEFRKLDESQGVKPVLERITAVPPLDLAVGEDTEARFAEIEGGISIALARSFKLIDPSLKNPASEHWQRSFELFDLLL